MRPEQKFIVTEFPLVWWWQRNMKGVVNPAFADKYQAPRNAQNWQIIKAALETPFPKEQWDDFRSEEHTSELQSLMRISYAVFCLTQNITISTSNSTLDKQTQNN